MSNSSRPAYEYRGRVIEQLTRDGKSWVTQLEYAKACGEIDRLRARVAELKAAKEPGPAESMSLFERVAELELQLQQALGKLDNLEEPPAREQSTEPKPEPPYTAFELRVDVPCNAIVVRSLHDQLSEAMSELRRPPRGRHGSFSLKLFFMQTSMCELRRLP